MEKGILIITKKGGAKVKRADGKETNILTKYDYSALLPTSGKNRIDCEYEANDKKQAIKVFIDGQELPQDTAAEQKKQERIANQKAEAERNKLAEIEQKRNAALSKQFGKDSFNIKNAFCPKDTAGLNIQAYEVENFALKLNKFARFVENDRDYSKSKFDFFKSGRREPEYQIQSNYGTFDFEAFAKKNLDNVKAFLGENCKSFPMSTNGRLITGLGSASVYETAIALHHIYGFPYLPASGIKGMVRSYIIQEAFENKEEKALANSGAFCYLFGCQKTGSAIGKDQQGKVLFFDAFPLATPNVVPDIMNPHYGPYYNGDGNVPPADYHNPVPIFFLTVDKKTEFQFILGSKEDNWLKKEYKIENEDIIWWLTQALQNHGIGAKTAVGYGYFEQA